MFLRHNFSRRDALLMIIGAALWHLWHMLDSTTPAASPSLLFDTSTSPSFDATINATNTDTNTKADMDMDINMNTNANRDADANANTSDDAHTHGCAWTIQPLLQNLGEPASTSTSTTLPHTSIIAHAPGWTIFRNLYMSNGTLYILSEPGAEGTHAGADAGFPAMRMMMSTGLAGFATPESIAAREPTARDIDFVSPQEARKRWGGGSESRVRVIEGNTFFFNDPDQFLNHYYHFVAELFFGAWSFWTGAWPAAADTFPQTPLSPHQHQYQRQQKQPPEITRIIFPHVDARGWRDKPGFNAYFLRGAFPSLGVEVREDWADRVTSTAGTEHERAWRFPVVLVADRSAAFRGEACGRTQRTAAEAVEYMIARRRLGVRGSAGVGEGEGAWWAPLRAAMWDYAGVATMHAEPEPESERIVITYVSRQRGPRRKLKEGDHAGLVEALEGLVRRRGKGWEFVVMEAEGMSKDAQVRAAARTTILLGVHGNGLTHLVFMKPTRLSAVVEIFYQGGFAHDYHWTARALGMEHYAMWNDTYITHPDEPSVNYPEGFQGNEIVVDGASVARLVEEHVDKRTV